MGTDIPATGSGKGTKGQLSSSEFFPQVFSLNFSYSTFCNFHCRTPSDVNKARTLKAKAKANAKAYDENEI